MHGFGMVFKINKTRIISKVTKKYPESLCYYYVLIKTQLRWLNQRNNINDNRKNVLTYPDTIILVWQHQTLPYCTSHITDVLWMCAQSYFHVSPPVYQTTWCYFGPNKYNSRDNCSVTKWNINILNMKRRVIYNR